MDALESPGVSGSSSARVLGAEGSRCARLALVLGSGHHAGTMARPTMARLGLGRPRGSSPSTGGSTSARALDQAAQGALVYDAGCALNVSVRTMRRYLKRSSRIRPRAGSRPAAAAACSGGSARERFPARWELRRTQAYALVAARRIFEPLAVRRCSDEIDMAIGKLLGCAATGTRAQRRAGRCPVWKIASSTGLPLRRIYATRTEELDTCFRPSPTCAATCSYRSAHKAAEERITIHPYAMVLHETRLLRRLPPSDEERYGPAARSHARHRCAVTERFELPRDFDVNSTSRESRHLAFDRAAQGCDRVRRPGRPYVRMRRLHHTQRFLVGIAAAASV